MLGGRILRAVYVVGRNSLFIESSEDSTLEVPLDPKIQRNPRRVAFRGKNIQKYFFFNWKIPTLETNQSKIKEGKVKKKFPPSINKEKVIKQHCEV